MVSESMRLLVVLLLMACGGPEDPHAEADCDQGWLQNGFDQCEAACANSSKALGASGAACQAETIEGAPVSCSKTLEFEGVVGCCSTDGTEVHFAECE
jgi:hypothetical protein